MKRAAFSLVLVLSLLTLMNESKSSEILQSAQLGMTKGGGPVNISAIDCTIGNEESSPEYVANFIQEQIEFAFLVEPSDLVCCAEGFFAESITFYLFISTFNDMFTSFVQVGVCSAEGGAGGLIPGEELCVTPPPPTWYINCDITGFYTLTIPPYPTEDHDLVCPCLSSGSPYFLFWRILSDDLYGARPDAARDSSPVGGKSYVRYGEGPWEDVVLDLGWLGEHVITASVNCCEEPVAIEEINWGYIKSIYR